MDFRNLDGFLSSLDEIGVNGCAASVWSRGENVFRKFYGTQDAEGKVPTNEKTVYSLFSMSKLFTSCAAMMLIERGKMKLDDPISQWLPAYGRMTWKNGEEILPCQNAITVEDLMSMQTGFDYDIFAPEIKKATEIYQGNL